MIDNKNLSLLKISNFILCCILLIIWTLPNTIHIRNIVLITGGIISIFILLRENFFKNNNSIEFKFIILLYIWIFIHYIFIGIDHESQLKELTGLWFRCTLCILMVGSLVLFLRERPNYLLILLLFIGSTVILNLFYYCIESYNKQKFLLPGSTLGKPFNKIETVFWGSIWVAFSLAIINYFLSKSTKLIKIKYVIFSLIIIILSLISAIISNSKNSVFIISILLIIFTFFISIKIYNLKYNRLNIVIIGSLLIIGIGLNSVHYKFSPGWESLVSDFKIGIQIEKYYHWKNTELYGYPDHVSSYNIYERISWGTAGLKLILDNPYGYGLVNQSFEKILNLNGSYYKINRQTHSGWIDFGLAFGIPGLLTVLSLSLCIIYKGFKQASLLSLMGAWVSLAILVMGLFSEIVYKQFFEATIFWLTFGAFSVSIAKYSKQIYPLNKKIIYEI